MRRSYALLLGVFLVIACGRCVALADDTDVPYLVTIDGRLLDATHPGARDHDGALYINVLRGVRAFDGELDFKRDVLRVTVGKRSIDYTLGVAKAEIGGKRIELPAAPYDDGDSIFVPLASFAALAHAAVLVDSNTHRVDLSVPKESIAIPKPPPTPMPPVTTPAPTGPVTSPSASSSGSPAP